MARKYKYRTFCTIIPVDISEETMSEHEYTVIFDQFRDNWLNVLGDDGWRLIQLTEISNEIRALCVKRFPGQ